MAASTLSFIICSIFLCNSITSSQAAQLSIASAVTCSDGTQCPDGYTCCLKQGGGYGCCPQQNAVCCDDKIHCCPQNTKCDVAGGGCVSPLDSNIPQSQWVNRLLSFIRSSDVSSNQQKQESIAAVEGELSVVSDVGAGASVVVCPDRKSQCPDYNTCCLMPNHQWICCGLPFAACCPDGFHCCPHGYRCDATSSHCFLGDPRVAFLTVISSSGLRKHSNL